MTKRMLAACLLPLLWGTVRADSIDDAEAKRRGVPLAQIQAEDALAAQKRKTQDAEKQAADLEKKIAEAQVRLATGNLDAPVLPNAMPRLAKLATDPALPKLLDGPRKSSPAYDAIIEHYMKGDLSTLLADIGSKQGGLAGLPATNASDIAYIRAAVAECRPAWWDRAKAGNKMQFQTNIFGREITYLFTNSPGGWIATAGVYSGKGVVNVGWPVQVMDGKNTFGFTDASIPPISAGDFTWVEGGQLMVWQALGQRIPQLEVGMNKVETLEPADKVRLEERMTLRKAQTVFYYASPMGRRMATAMAAYSGTRPAFGKASWDRDRSLIPWLLAEFIGHREQYPSIDFSTLPTYPESPQTSVAPNTPLAYEEYMLDNGLANAIFNAHLTFAEDCRLRQSLWDYAQSDGDPIANGTTLYNGLTAPFDDHGKAARIRYEWLRKQLESKPADTAPAQP